MPQDSGFRADGSGAASSTDNSASRNRTNFSANPAEPHRLSELSRALAAYGAGTASADLALDLVLNEIVAKAQAATRASGAAIALRRDGEMVCRATSGETAPDLGVPVETASGLAGACMNTGFFQCCQDTETDPRVNADACRTLGVRSMLLVPIVDSGTVIGILQVFSARPYAFGNAEVDALRGFVERILASKVEPESRNASPSRRREDSLAAEVSSASRMEPGREEIERIFHRNDAEQSAGSDLWTSILFILVLLVAVFLGLVIGWRRGSKDFKTAVQSIHQTSVSSSGLSAPESAPSQSGSAANSLSASGPEVQRPKAPGDGLLITQDGKAIYPLAQTLGPAKSRPDRTTQLVHRVEPQYPAEAKAQHLQGTVVMDVRILADGRVGNIAVVSGDPILARAAVEAVRQWVFQADSVRDAAAEREARISIRFSLPSV